MKSGIIYKKIVMQAGDDEQRMNYEWLCFLLGPLSGILTIANPRHTASKV